MLNLSAREFSVLVWELSFAEIGSGARQESLMRSLAYRHRPRDPSGFLLE